MMIQKRIHGWSDSSVLVQDRKNVVNVSNCNKGELTLAENLTNVSANTAHVLFVTL